eukprot:TRINITY_DN30238_c0_g1_i1.p1 TRINITY_DN30238_c0_g1~~TRINITY_DN30238_c0_g1_i1.p1  ORF type:complete len:873 (+),score=298.60 TRINITY_DN30238_c0_g1_i1:61-2679(+)
MDGEGSGDAPVNQESLLLKQQEIEEQLKELKSRRTLSQQVVDNVDGDALRQKNTEHVRASRLAMDRSSGRALLARRRQLGSYYKDTDEDGPAAEPAASNPSPEAPPAARPPPRDSVTATAPIHQSLSSITRPAAGAASSALQVDGTDLEVGAAVWIKDDVHLIRSAASANSIGCDYTKELYCGEKGRVVKLYPLLPEPQRGADVKFLDSETRFFTLACLERTRGSAAAQERRLLATARAAGVKTDGGKKAAPAPAAEAPAPRAAPSARKPAAKPAAAAAKPATAAARSTSEAATAGPKAASRSRSTAGGAPAPAPAAADAGEVKVGKRITIVQNGKTVTATVQFVGATEFADGEWAGLELATPDGKNDGTVKDTAYFKCKPNHGLFRRVSELGAKDVTGSDNKEKPADRKPVAAAKRAPAAAAVRKAAEKEEKTKPQAEKPKPKPTSKPLKVTPVVMASTRTVRLWENGQYGSTVDSVPYKTMAIRPVHKTLKSVLISAARELGWHLLKRNVETLFYEDGSEVKDLGDIRNGDNLVASWGEALIVPDAPLPKMKGIKEQPPRHVDPMAQGPGTPPKRGGDAAGAKTPPAARPTPIPTFTSGANRIVKVFENGVYGSKWSDSVPCVTVTVRSNFKTTGAVKTMLGRELKWNTIGRKVDAIYNAVGEEIEDVECICSGDVLVASSGDLFVKPHADLAELFPAPKISVEQFRKGMRRAALEPASPATSRPAAPAHRAVPSSARRHADNKENTAAAPAGAAGAGPKPSKASARPFNARTNTDPLRSSADLSASQSSAGTPQSPSGAEFPRDLGALSTAELLAESKKLTAAATTRAAAAPDGSPERAGGGSSTRAEIDKLLAEIATLEAKASVEGEE